MANANVCSQLGNRILVNIEKDRADAKATLAVMRAKAAKAAEEARLAAEEAAKADGSQQGSSTAGDSQQPKQGSPAAPGSPKTSRRPSALSAMVKMSAGLAAGAKVSEIAEAPAELPTEVEISQTARYIIFKSLDKIIYRDVKLSIRSAKIDPPNEKGLPEAALLEEHKDSIAKLKKFKEVN